jgi:subtilisin family serine protease
MTNKIAQTSRHRALSILQVVMVGALVSFVACEPAPEPASGPHINAAVQPQDSTKPFYYYQGVPVYLNRDVSRLVVASSSLVLSSDVNSALTQLGVPTQRIDVLPQAAGHWLVYLAPGTTAETTLAATRRLKADSRFEFASTAFKTIEGNADVALLNRLAVQFRPGVSQAAIDSLNGAMGTHVIRPPRPDSGFGEYWLAYPPGASVDPLAVAAAYDRSPLVVWADPDKLSDYKTHLTPTDPFYTSQYYLKNSTTLNGVPVDDNVELAWNYTLGGGAPSSGGITVAVIDAGVEATQEDLNGRVLFGYDAFGNNTFGCSDCADAPFGDDYHGTSVAGIVGASQNNGLGVTGVAPGVWILPVRIFRGDQVASACQIGSGINFAWQLGAADVLSNSWGGGAQDNCITSAINAAATQGRSGNGALVVFSAGNTSARSQGIIGSPTWQAQLSNVLSVGAVDRNGALTDYTPEGSGIGLVAPSGHYTDVCPRLGGVGPFGDVVTTDRSGSAGCNDGPGGNVNYTSTFSGTSAAAPQVSGVAALLYSLEPGLTMSQARSRVQAGADPWGSNTQYGSGKVDALFTLKPLSVGINGPNDITQAGTYTWTASPLGGTGSYALQWQYRPVNSSTWSTVGSGTSYSRSVGSADPNFYLMVTVTSAWRSNLVTITVLNESGGTCNPRC